MAGPSPLPEALRRALAADPKPVSPLAPPLVRALLAAVWAVCALFLVLALLGLRGDAARLGPLLTWGPALAQVALGLVLVSLALAAAVPGRGAATALSALAAVAAVTALAAEAVLARRASPGIQVPDPWLVHGPACFSMTVLFGISALVLVAALVARTSPLRTTLPALLGGAGCGVMAEGIFRLHCGITDLRHVLVWHSGAVVVLALAGLAAGLAWDRREAARMAARLSS